MLKSFSSGQGCSNLQTTPVQATEIVCWAEGIARAGWDSSVREFLRRADEESGLEGFASFALFSRFMLLGNLCQAQILYDSMGGSILEQQIQRKSAWEWRNRPQSIWSTMGPYQVWSRTNFAVNLRETMVDDFIHMLREEAPPSNMPCILDLGTGDGLLIGELALAIQKHFGIKSMRVIIVDKVPESLDIASQNIKRIAGSGTSVVPLCCDIEHLNVESVRELTGNNLWFCFASACLHHLPRRRKEFFISRIRNVVADIWIAELEGNHDSPPAGSSELLYSLYNFYSYLLRDLFQSQLSCSDIESCAKDFIALEAITAAIEPYENRQNFHMTLNEWNEMATRMGALVKSHARSLDVASPRSLLVRCQFK